MNIDKILLWIWILFWAVLVIGNMVIWGLAFVLWYPGEVWIYGVCCIIIWVLLWYWIRGMQEKSSASSDEYGDEEY